MLGKLNTETNPWVRVAQRASEREEESGRKKDKIKTLSWKGGSGAKTHVEPRMKAWRPQFDP